MEEIEDVVGGDGPTQVSSEGYWDGAFAKASRMRASNRDRSGEGWGCPKSRTSWLKGGGVWGGVWKVVWSSSDVVDEEDGGLKGVREFGCARMAKRMEEGRS